MKKHWVDNTPLGKPDYSRKGMFIAVGATKGKKLFDGALLTVRYFFDVMDMQLWHSLLYRGMDFEGDVLKHPQYLDEAYQAGTEFAAALKAE